MSLKTSEELITELFTLVKEAAQAEEGSEFGSCTPDLYHAFGGKIVLAVYSGSIGLPCIDDFKASLAEIICKDVLHIIINLEEVQKLSRTAVGVLVDFSAGVMGMSKRLYLLKPSQAIVERLNELKLGGFFKLLFTDDDLIRILPID